VKLAHAAPSRIFCPLAAVAIAAAALASGPFQAIAQSQSGFTYNGMDLISYSQSEYLSSNEAAQTIRATGANYTAVMATWYVQTYTSTTIAPDSSTPSDAAIVAAIQSLQAQGITVTLKPHVDSVDGIWRGDFTWPSSATTTAAQQAWLQAWFTSYESFILHFAKIASDNNVGTLVIGTEFAKLTGNTCAGSCESYWLQYVINPIRAAYPNLTLAYGANATSAGDEFTTVTFWDDIDIIGVDGYFPLTGQQDPSITQLVNAWTIAADNTNHFNPFSALQNLQSAHSTKPLIFTEIGYESTPGTNEQPYNFSVDNGVDDSEQANCYQAFFQVFSGQPWMHGVFWWDWSVSAPNVSTDTGYSPQGKYAGTTILPEWYESTAASFTLAPANSALTVGQGLSASTAINVTPLGGFTGGVTLAATGLPMGVTASFAPNPTTGSSVLTLTASGSAAIGGPVTVTITGTSNALTATTTIALTVRAAQTQTITFANPGAQQQGTQLSLVATASSGLPVSFSSSTTGVCTVSGTTAALSGTGTCTITAAQAGNGVYSAAPSIMQSFLVATLPPVPVPADAEVIMSQVNWLAALGGYVQTSNNSTGGSFGVNAHGEIAVADTDNLNLIDTRTGALTKLGAWAGISAAAVDGNNNIYVGSLYGSPEIVVKLPYVGGTANGGYAAFTAPTTGLAACTPSSTTECAVTPAGAVYPDAMAFDAKGDLFWITSSTGGTGGNGIWECSAACLGGSGSPVQLCEEPTAGTPPSTSSGQLLAGSLAIDSAGNLFFTDSSTYVNTGTFAYTSFYSNLNELPVAAGVGYGGKTTGYSASPTALYTLTPSSIGAYDNDVDAVAVLRNTTSGDTVYFADQSDGVFAFPDTSTGIPTANGQPTALYAVSTQGAKVMTVDGTGNLYIAVSSAVINTSYADTVAQLTLDNVTVPASPIGSPVSPSSTLNPVSVVLNDTACSGNPAPAVSFVAGVSTTASATLATAGSCASTLNGGSTFAASVSFTPEAGGTDSISLTGTDQSNNTGTVTVSGTGAGFTLSVANSSLSVTQGGSNTDIITVTDVGGFAGSVTLAATGLPSGVTASFAAGTVAGTQVMTLTAASTATLGGPVTVTITGTSGAVTATTTVALTVNPPPSFTLSAQSGSVSVAQGSTATDTITVTPANGFSGGVTLTATGLPSGVTASFSPNPTTTGTSVLTLTATGTAATGGPVTVTITGTSGSLTETATIALTVDVAPGFTLSPSPASVTVLQGGTATSTITIAGTGGFAGAVTLAATGLPTGVTASFAAGTAGTQVLTLTAASAATIGGPVTATITGTSGSLTASTTIAVTVNAPPSFTLSAQTPSLTMAQGGTVTDTITVTPAGGFSGSVTLAASGLPIGVTATFAPGSGNTQVMTLTALSSAEIGMLPVTISGTSGSLTASTTVQLTVAVPPSFSLSASPGSLSIAQGTSGTSTITITDVGGFVFSATLSATGLPSGVTASFSTNPTTTSSVMTLTASGTATPIGPVPVTITGMSGNLPEQTTIQLTVTGSPSFAISGPSGAISIQPGATTGNTVSLSVAGSNGFSGAVNLTCAVTPAAASEPPTCSLSPASVTVSGNTAQVSTLTVTTTAASKAANDTQKLFWPSAGGTALALVLFFGVPRRRRNWLAMVALLALSISLAAIGCGGGGSGGGGGGGGNAGTTPGSYTITVTGSSSAGSGTAATIGLTVQ
jgi:hypothetical protein